MVSIGRFSILTIFYYYIILLIRKSSPSNYSAVHGKKIHWPGGRERPPPDVPPCGFLGNAPECHDNGNYLEKYLTIY